MAACPACWAMGDKEIAKKKQYFVQGRLEQSRQNKNHLYRHDKPNKLTKEGSLSFVLFESPFTSVSTVSRVHPSLVSLHPPPTLHLRQSPPLQPCQHGQKWLPGPLQFTHFSELTTLVRLCTVLPERYVILTICYSENLFFWVYWRSAAFHIMLHLTRNKARFPPLYWLLFSTNLCVFFLSTILV